MSENFPAGSATGIDLALTPYGYAAEARDGHVTFFKERPTGFDQPKWNGLVKVVELYDRAPATPQHPRPADLRAEFEKFCDDMTVDSDAEGRNMLFDVCSQWDAHRATPQHSATEQASIDTPEFRSLMDEFEKSVGRSTLERDDAEFAIIRHIDDRAQPLASTEATQPEQANAMACGQCFGKGVIANIGETCDLCNGSGLESCDCGTHTKSACDLAGACGPKDGTALTHRATTADEQATHLTDEGHQASIASFMTTPGFKEALAELVADQQGDTASASFADWLAREMPAGTVIGDPAWWAPRILRAAQQGAAQAQAGEMARLWALHAAVSAIYFDDSSDFRWALGSVIRHLDPVLAGEVLENPKAAYDKVSAAIAAPATSNGSKA